MGEPKKKPGRSRKNGTDWELRRYVMLLAAVIVLILMARCDVSGKIQHSGEKGWLTGRNGGYRRLWNGD